MTRVGLAGEVPAWGIADAAVSYQRGEVMTGGGVGVVVDQGDPFARWLRVVYSVLTPFGNGWEVRTASEQG